MNSNKTLFIVLGFILTIALGFFAYNNLYKAGVLSEHLSDSPFADMNSKYITQFKIYGIIQAVGAFIALGLVVFQLLTKNVKTPRVEEDV